MAAFTLILLESVTLSNAAGMFTRFPVEAVVPVTGSFKLPVRKPLLSTAPVTSDICLTFPLASLKSPIICPLLFIAVVIFAIVLVFVPSDRVPITYPLPFTAPKKFASVLVAVSLPLPSTVANPPIKLLLALIFEKARAAPVFVFPVSAILLISGAAPAPPSYLNVPSAFILI